MALTLLERAKRSFRRKRYNDVITILEPNVIQYRDSFPFYFYLGLACLHTGDVGGATSYFQRARQIKMRDPELLVAQAALYLRRGETHQAVEYYLEALEYDPGHRLARRSLDFIRRFGEPERIAALVETGKIRKFYPRPKAPFPMAGAVGLAALLGAAALVYFFAVPSIRNANDGQARADLSSVELDGDDRANSLELGGNYRYILTERQVLAAHAAAQRYFQDYRDNAAQVEINRILYSNAGTGIKQKARLLMTFLKEPGFDTIRDSYEYAKVVEDPWLYLDCWVVWKGMATNVVETEHSVSFDFLVGYDTRNTLEGIVPVRFLKVLPVDPGKPLEILARVSLENGKIALAGNGIFQTGKPSN